MMANAISTIANPVESRGISLVSLKDFIDFGKMVADTDFAPKAMKGKPADCALAIIYGSELGVTPMAALQNIAVINGKPSVYGDLLLALCMGSPLCSYVKEKVDGEGDAMVATCETLRRGYESPTVRTFSMTDAKTAGLLQKDGPWKQYTSRMLAMRARGFALRDAFPDVLRGVISAEEAQDYQTITVPSEPVNQPPWTASDDRPAGPKNFPPSMKTPIATTQPQEPVTIDPKQATIAREQRKPAEDAERNGLPAADDAPLSITDRAIMGIRICNSREALKKSVDKADGYLISKTITKEEHEKIIEALNERADFLRSTKEMGEPSDA
jgi:hypothetical protein